MINKHSLLAGILVCGSTLVLSGCGNVIDKPGNPTISAIQKTLQQGMKDNQQVEKKHQAIPENVQQALLPKLTLPHGQFMQVEPRFDVSADNIDAQEFFLGLVHDTKYNIVVSPRITDKITLHLKDVTIEQVLSALHNLYGYVYSKTAYGFEVMPNQLTTQMFKVNYIDATRTGSSYIAVQSGLISQQQQTSTSETGTTSTSSEGVATPSSSISTKTEVNFWSQLKEALTAIVGDKDGHTVSINPVTGIVIIRTSNDQMQKVGEYLDTLNSIVSRQVLIQAEILRITLNKGFQSGINWSKLGISQTTTGSSAPTTPGDFTSAFTLDKTFGGVATLVKLLSTQGNVQVLSSPRIATINNQKAIIKVGQDEYFITKVSSTVTGGIDSQATQDVTMEPFFSGISLAVTPTIMSDDRLMLQIHPIISTVKDQNKQFTIGGRQDSIPSALSEVDESENVVYSNSGQLVILGGLSKNSTEEEASGVPFFSKIPFLGALFRGTKQNSQRQELVILLRPTIMNDKALVQSLEQTNAQFERVNQGYHLGSFPNRFGTLGETQNLDVRNNRQGA